MRIVLGYVLFFVVVVIIIYSLREIVGAYQNPPPECPLDLSGFAGQILSKNDCDAAPLSERVPFLGFDNWSKNAQMTYAPLGRQVYLQVWDFDQAFDFPSQYSDTLIATDIPDGFWGAGHIIQTPEKKLVVQPKVLDREVFLFAGIMAVIGLVLFVVDMFIFFGFNRQ